jgi:hypothetical protein
VLLFYFSISAATRCHREYNQDSNLNCLYLVEEDKVRYEEVQSVNGANKDTDLL